MKSKIFQNNTKKIIHREYKKNYNGLFVLGIIIFILSITIIISVRKIDDKFHRINPNYASDADLDFILNANVMFFIIGIGMMLSKLLMYNRDNYTEIELEGKIIPPKPLQQRGSI